MKTPKGGELSTSDLFLRRKSNDFVHLAKILKEKEGIFSDALRMNSFGKSIANEKGRQGKGKAHFDGYRFPVEGKGTRA